DDNRGQFAVQLAAGADRSARRFAPGLATAQQHVSLGKRRAVVTDIQIRQAQIDDAEDIVARIKTANTADEIRDQIATFASNREKGGWEHLFAVSSEGVIDNIVVMPSRYYPTGEAHRGELADIVIAAIHQGTGLLRRLVEAAIARAREMGITQIETSTWSSNDRAVGAYKGVRFQRWGVLRNAIKRDDGSFDAIVCYVMDLS
ncbi:MAG: GNAT family N-acetyltransferase, partial [Vicinamibacterales bacterium]